ncbi:MAG: phosphate acyltransferase PlsX [Opitutales bacterium]
MSPLPAVALDVMGADRGVPEVLAALPSVLQSRSDARIILVGDEQQIRPELGKLGLDGESRLDVQHAASVITMEDKPKQAYKAKKDSSMLSAIALVAEGKAGAVVSCGNTGVLQFSSTLMLRKCAGLERPALATMMPSRNHHWLLVDAGAEPNTTARQLALNGVLGSAYYAAVTDTPRPRVGLLTIGTEEGKGTDRIAAAHKLLKQLDGLIEYKGLVEGFDTFNQGAEVVVTDGFTGNIVLKTLQSCLRTFNGFLREALKANPWRMLGAAIAKGGFDAVKREFDPARYGGAPLLGLNGLAFKTHGSSDRHYVAGALRIAIDSLAHELPTSIAAKVEAAAERLKTPEAIEEAAAS